MRRKVFFLGCNTDQLPYLRAAKEAGFNVVGTDINAGAPGASLADRFYQVSYTDIAGLSHVAGIEGYTKDDRVFTAASHFAYEGAAALAALLGIPFISPNAVDICLNKTRFYAFLEERGVPVPPNVYVGPDNFSLPDIDKIYFLKSDYGKSPKYCYRIVDGQVPPLPAAFDQFYRNCFVLQEAIEGTHFRVNLYAGQVATFMKFSDTVAMPLRTMGPGHKEVVVKLSEVVSDLGLDGFLTKFDLVVDETDWYVIDIGLDTPLRLKLLCDYLRVVDFPMAYVRYYLLGDAEYMPLWSKLYRPVIIQGTPEQGFIFREVEAE